MQVVAGGGSNVSGSYKVYMSLTAWQWLSYPDFYAQSIKRDFDNGKLTQAQVDAIWKKRDTTIADYRDVNGTKGNAAPNPTTPTNSWGGLNIDASGVVDAAKDGIKAIGDAITGGGKYVVIGIVGIVIILIFGRK